MKRVIAMIIEDGNDARLEVTAASNDSASIFITAHNLQTAITQLEIGEEQAIEACKNYIPKEIEPEEEQPKKHYRMPKHAIEDIEESIEEYKATAKGKRFVRSLELSNAFRKKNDGGGLLYSELEYLYLLTLKDTYEGLFAMQNISFRRGYNKAKKKYKA